MKENFNKRRMKKLIIISLTNGMESKNSNTPNQYARVKTVAKREEVIKDNKDQTYDFL
jgi:hypothetical protein